MSSPKIPLALPVPGFRRGLLGNLPVDAAYLQGVENRARMLAKACRCKGFDVEPRVDARQGDDISLSLENYGNKL